MSGGGGTMAAPVLSNPGGGAAPPPPPPVTTPMVAPIPHSVEDLELNASDIKTLSDKNFLFYDSGPEPGRIVM